MGARSSDSRRFPRGKRSPATRSRDVDPLLRPSDGRTPERLERRAGKRERFFGIWVGRSVESRRIRVGDHLGRETRRTTNHKDLRARISAVSSYTRMYTHLPGVPAALIVRVAGHEIREFT